MRIQQSRASQDEGPGLAFSPSRTRISLELVALHDLVAHPDSSRRCKLVKQLRPLDVEGQSPGPDELEHSSLVLLPDAGSQPGHPGGALAEHLASSTKR